MWLRYILASYISKRLAARTVVSSVERSWGSAGLHLHLFPTTTCYTATTRVLPGTPPSINLQKTVLIFNENNLLAQIFATWQLHDNNYYIRTLQLTWTLHLLGHLCLLHSTWSSSPFPSLSTLQECSPHLRHRLPTPPSQLLLQELQADQWSYWPTQRLQSYKLTLSLFHSCIIKVVPDKLTF